MEESLACLFCGGGWIFVKREDGLEGDYSKLVPSLEVLCGYLGIKLGAVKINYFEELSGYFNDDFKCSRSLCSGCEEKFNTIVNLTEQLKEIQERLEGLVGNVREIITSSRKDGGGRQQEMGKLFQKFVAQAVKADKPSATTRTFKVLIRKMEESSPPINVKEEPPEVEEDDEEDDFGGGISNEDSSPPSSPPPFFQCPDCPSKLKSAGNLENHQKIFHTPDALKRYPCPHCPRGFVHRNTLKHHVNQVHLKIRHKCDICPKSFSSKSFLKDHKLTHKDGGFALTCDICGRKLGSMVSLRSHRRNQHENPGPVPCEICGRVFPNTNSLSSHKTTVHKESRCGRGRRRENTTWGGGISSKVKKSKRGDDDDGGIGEEEMPIIIKRISGGGIREEPQKKICLPLPSTRVASTKTQEIDLD